MGFLFGFVMGFVWAKSLIFNSALFYGDCAALGDIEPRWLKLLLFLSGPIFAVWVRCGGLKVGGPSCEKCNKQLNLCKCSKNNRRERW
ncbi:MAG: hypothetical protein HY226_01280 [Candidatus Vogelbacteria bacterium]|nr:hypothetical protein [Candidatus Vogelbacteria bacterium]